MRSLLSAMVSRRGLKELETIAKETDIKAGEPDNTPKNLVDADPAPFAIGLVGFLFVWAVNHLMPGTITIIPGHPVLDAVIIGAIIGVFVMFRRFKKVRDLQEIREIQEELAPQEEEKLLSGHRQ